MDEQGQGDAPAPGSESDADVTGKLVGVVNAHDVHLAGSAAGVVVAAGNLSIANGGCGPVRLPSITPLPRRSPPRGSPR